jgi:hypothetical protein
MAVFRSAGLNDAMEFPILHRPESNGTALFHNVVVRAKLSKSLDIRPPWAAAGNALREVMGQ